MSIKKSNIYISHFIKQRKKIRKKKGRKIKESKKYRKEKKEEEGGEKNPPIDRLSNRHILLETTAEVDFATYVPTYGRFGGGLVGKPTLLARCSPPGVIINRAGAILDKTRAQN